jgi:cysteine desulfurase
MTASSSRPIYLDYQSTTPCDPRVVEAMLPYFTEHFGNPHASSHAYGEQARAAVEDARSHVADLVGGRPEEIVFTSGATESNNLAIKGVARAYQGDKDHLVTVATEHRAVLDPCRRLEADGFRVTRLPVQPDGLLDLQTLEAAITPRTALVSVMAVNNEIGVVQPLAAIGALCRSRGVLVHSDASQGAGKVALDVEAMGIDLLSLSGHKIYGPKGIGALFVRRRPRLRLAAQIEGGGQERGLRAGTLPTPLCVGLGEACRIAGEARVAEEQRIRVLRERLLKGMVDRLSPVRVNGDLTRRIAGNLNLSFFGIATESLLLALKSIAVSGGSACASGAAEPSHVLGALGVDAESWASIRIGLGRFTSTADVDRAVDDIVQAVTRLRNLSPIWDGPSPPSDRATSLACIIS